MRFNFDRYNRWRKMAEGIAIHAGGYLEAENKALDMVSEGDSIVLRDNERCTKGYCKECDESQGN